MARDPAPLIDDLTEAEQLLRFPAVEGHLQRASKLLLGIARKSPAIEARTAAMQALSLIAAFRLPVPVEEDSANLYRLLEQARQGLLQDQAPGRS